MTLISKGEKPTELSFISLRIQDNLHLVSKQWSGTTYFSMEAAEREHLKMFDPDSLLDYC